jgi:phosphatidylethanolamine N-methyltransferase
VNDFTAYIIFALAYTELPNWSEFGFFDLLRFIGGFALMAFNWWVKFDAHRVVKDFAWCKFAA